MPTGLARRPAAAKGRGRPLEQLDLIRKVRERRKHLGLTLEEVAAASGYYGKSMLSVLERSLSPEAEPKPRMSRRGIASLQAWLDAQAGAGRGRALP